MIEIFLLSFLCKKMGNLLRDKGWNTTFWMQLAVIVTWFGGIIVATFVYTVYVLITKGQAAAEHPDLMVLYPLCFLGGGAGVSLLFTIVSFFPSHDLPPTWIITADTQ
jgi:drug/metabolite transporter (DMT)-like permease